MPALPSWPAVRRWLLLFLLVLFTAQAFATSITIGTLTFLGTSDPSDPHKPMFVLALHTQRDFRQPCARGPILCFLKYKFLD